MKVRALAEWAIVLASVAACSGGEATKPPPTPVPTSIQLSATSVSLRIAESRQLTATVLDQQNRPMTGQAITWSTSDTTKVNVDDAGLVRGVRVGSATLTARSGALSASAAATVLAPATQIETAAAVTATIGEQGGAITAQAGNGTRFTLTVPPLAVTSDTGITLTPITTIENLPLGATLVTALRLQPDGLEFLAPATLTIDLPAAAAPSGLFGLRFADDWSFTLTPIAVTGTRLTMSIAHFSGAGAGYLTCPPNIPISGTPRDIALSDLAIEQCKAQSTGSWNAAAVINILHKWYTVSVKPNLQGASSSTTANASFGEWAEWRHTIDNYLSVVGPISSLNQDVAEAAPLAVAVVKGEIARQNQKCIADQDLHAAHKVFLWQLKAQAELIATSANGLDVATVQAGICVKVEIDQTNFPDPVQEGTAATLTVQAGLRFGTGSVVYSRPLEVSVTVTGAAPASGVKMTNSAGQATFSVTPSPGGSTVRVDIHVALKTQQLDAYGVFRNTTVVRQASVVSVNINPSAAILNPGTQATFTATVTGVQNTAVTWTATGGTITGGGVYTAGQTAGVYQVKATSVGNPLKSGTAQVTIEANSVLRSWKFDSDLDGWTGGTAGAPGDENWGTVFRISRSGNGMAKLDGTGSPGTPNSWIFQSVTLPASAQSLQFDVSGHDRQGADALLKVRMVTSGGTSVVLMNQVITGVDGALVFSTRTVNIAAFAGQTVTFYFEQDDNGFQGQFPGAHEQIYLDNIQILRAP
jgi:hypothetical protein